METPSHSLRWTNRSFKQPLLLCGGMLTVGNLLYGLVSQVGNIFYPLYYAAAVLCPLNPLVGVEASPID